MACVDSEPLIILEATSCWPIVAEFRTLRLLPTPTEPIVDADPPTAKFPAVERLQPTSKLDPKVAAPPTVTAPPTANHPIVLIGPPMKAAPPVDSIPPIRVELLTVSVKLFVIAFTCRVVTSSPDARVMLAALRIPPTNKLHDTETDEKTDIDPVTVIELLKSDAVFTVRLLRKLEFITKEFVSCMDVPAAAVMGPLK